MKNDVVSVQALPGYQLQVQLSDGTTGVFDMSPFLQLPGMQALANPSYFASVGVFLGAATWPEGEDISPDTLAAGLKQHQTA